jgi:hypothetical protein
VNPHSPEPKHPSGEVVRIPFDGAAAGRLRFTAGAQDLDLVADEAIDDLCHARFAGSPPLITTRAGTIRVRYPRVLPWPFRSRPTIMRLNPTLPWDVEIHGGAQRVTADLRRAELTRLAVHGGASHVTLDLPCPRGTVSLRFAKGVHHLAIVRPGDTAARVSVNRGASDAHLDDQAFGAVGGPLHWQTLDYAAATDRYDITVGRGAGGITLAMAS